LLLLLLLPQAPPAQLGEVSADRSRTIEAARLTATRRCPLKGGCVVTRTADVQGLLIGGERPSNSSAGVYEHVFPGTGEVNARVVLAGPDDVDWAVSIAARAQREWVSLPVDDRRDALLALSDLIAANADSLAELSIEDNGNPKFISGLHPPQLVRWLRYYAGWVDKVTGQTTPVSKSADLNLIVHEPYGVIAAILPWNGPLYGIGMVVAPALAAGNAVIIKPPELAPLTSLRFGELALQAGLPAGLVSVLPADSVGSEALVRHPGVDKIHFTGSGAVATKILKAAADNLTPVATELGGKSANIILDDADLDMAAMLACFSGPLAQSGQNCACGSRILIQENVFEDVLARITMILRNSPIGDPRAADTVVGPVISESAVDRILGVVERAQADGAIVASGGRRVGGELSRGFFIEPTVITNVNPGGELFQQETFGPVASVSSFSDVEHAVALANNTTYGLVNYVHTTNLARAHTAASALQSGTVFVNTFPDLIPTAPYGGYKRSGVGRVGGLAGLLEFCQVKDIRIGLGPPALPI
jgi:aldehyde dehydrogenase (NAD+)